MLVGLKKLSQISSQLVTLAVNETDNTGAITDLVAMLMRDNTQTTEAT